MKNPTLIWDFDGTLGYRKGMFRGALLEAIFELDPTWSGDSDLLRSYLVNAEFPWNTPSRSHTEIQSPDAWWALLFPIFQRAFEGVGFSASVARDLAIRTRVHYVNIDRWRLFEDTIPTISDLTAEGWTHYILSNHTPELDIIVERLGLAKWIAAIFNSAWTGFEKPHPFAFQKVLERIPRTKDTWMIGDSMTADILGAESMGIRAILVRRYCPDAQRYCESLADVATMLEDSDKIKF